jgi:hypothetical protein
MKKYIVAINWFLVAIAATSSIAVAQSSAQNDPAWEAVRAVPYGEPLTVKLKGGTTVDGTVISASESNLKMYKSSESPTSGVVYDEIVDLKKEDILNVYRLEKKSGRKWVFIGAAAGAAVGAVTGMALSSIGNCSPSSGPFAGVFDDTCGKAKTGFIALGAVGGGASGAFIGDLIGRKRLKRILIYKSK